MSSKLDFIGKIKIPLPVEKHPTIWAMERYFDFYSKELKPIIAQYSLQQPDGMHGLDTHTDAVVFRGIDYAIHMGVEPLPVVFACGFHDMARTNDGPDFEHGKNAVVLGMKVMKQFPDLFDKDTKLAIWSAVLNHTSGIHAPDYISACLWDADRTRLAWKYGFDEKFFNTARGAFVASQYFQKYVAFQKKLFSTHQWSKAY